MKELGNRSTSGNFREKSIVALFFRTRCGQTRIEFHHTAITRSRHLAVAVSLRRAIFFQVRMYKHNVVHILYHRTWFVSGFCSLFTGWPAGSAVKRACLRGERPAFESRLAWAILFLLHLTFNLIIVLLAFPWIGYG